MAIVKLRVKVKVRVKIKVILYRPKDFVGVYMGKAIKGRYRHLSNSNLNLLIIFILTRKLYTSPNITRDITI